MLADTEGLSVYVDALGDTAYCFERVSIKSSVANLRNFSHGKGVGTSTNTAFSQSSPIYTEQAISVCVVGENSLYICKCCYAKIALKAKARDDFPKLTFCSDDCLQQAGPYLDFCGFVCVESCMKLWGDACTLVQLAVHYVYAISIASTADSLSHALQVLELESHPESISTDVLQTAAQWLYAHFQANLSASTLAALSTRGLCLANKVSGPELLYKLLRIIKYNAQAVPVHGVPKVQLLCLLHAVARLNHSCAPNCTLLYDVYRTTSTNSSTDKESSNEAESTYSLKLNVLALRDISSGEELTMSYIQPLCGSTDFRQSLLQQGFLFHCTCKRCSAPGVDSLLSAQFVALDKKLQTTMQDAQSSVKGVSYVSLHELITSADSGLQQLCSRADAVSCKSLLPVSEVHDAASFILQQSLLTLKTASTGGVLMDAAQQGKVLELIVRASLTLSVCWAHADCAHLLQRIEVAVSGSTYAVQLQKVGSVVKMKFACLKLFKKELEKVLLVLTSVYHCDQPGKLSEPHSTIYNVRERRMTAGWNRESIRIQRESSTLPYLHKLYQKAVENYKLLN